MDDSEFLGGFLGWYFTFTDSDCLTCPHCGADIFQDELEDLSDAGADHIICPYCNSEISKDDFEV